MKINNLKKIISSTQGLGLVGSMIGAGISLGAITYFMQFANISKNYEAQLKSSLQVNQLNHQIEKLFDSPEICQSFLMSQAGGSTPSWNLTDTEKVFTELKVGSEKIAAVADKLGIYEIESIKLTKKADLPLISYSGIDYNKYLLNLSLHYKNNKNANQKKSFTDTDIVIFVNNSSREIIKCHSFSLTSGNLEKICQGLGGNFNPIQNSCEKNCADGEYLENLSTGGGSQDCKPLPIKTCTVNGSPGQQIWNGSEFGPCIEIPGNNPRLWKFLGSVHTGGYYDTSSLPQPLLDSSALTGLPECPVMTNDLLKNVTSVYSSYGRTSMRGGGGSVFNPIVHPIGLVSNQIICDENNNYRCFKGVYTKYGLNSPYYMGTYYNLYFKIILECSE